jgi:hypothetical protein
MLTGTRCRCSVTELLEAGELKLIPDIAAVYAQIMKAHRKEVPVVFTFASVCNRSLVCLFPTLAHVVSSRFALQLPDKDFLSRQIERVKKYRLDADSTPIWEFKARTSPPTYLHHCIT